VTQACSVRVRGVVQGVGFRPFVLRLARANALAGWVLNAGEGVEIRLEGEPDGVESFLRALAREAPPAAAIAAIDVEASDPTGLHEFTIRQSASAARPTARISPDLALCTRCTAELFDPADPRHAYPYINCVDCGPRYSIVLGLPYDRDRTTMRAWPMDAACAAEYHDPETRRFHAQPVACPRCGPHLRLLLGGETVSGDDAAIRRTADLLRQGSILALKGIGGYHLACDARNADAVLSLRVRKFRKDKPFALMVRTVAGADDLVELTEEARRLLTERARPIVLARARVTLPGVAPDNHELGIMLPYAPLHELLFAAGAPDPLVLTSANRSSEPIAYEDTDAIERLTGIADAFLVGERPIARRVEDSVARTGPLGPMILRRSRGYAPGSVASIPSDRPVLALGADLKNTVTLVVDGQAFMSQHIGDLDHYQAFRAFGETIRDLLAMYGVDGRELVVVRDAHPQYRSTAFATELDAADERPVQHHRAHIASVLGEREAWNRRVLGAAFDGTGYGDDGTIWGGDIFVGSIAEGLQRVAHLRPAALVGGDAAAAYPVQAAAGFLHQVDGLPDLTRPPFAFGRRYAAARKLIGQPGRVFQTTSAGRLFDAAAALLGFSGAVTFEGQAAIWLEQLAAGASGAAPYPFPFAGGELDFRPLLLAMARDRARGRAPGEIARAFHAGVAQGLADALARLADEHAVDTVVVSGGVFQNQLLLTDLAARFGPASAALWANQTVPPNDGGISLGQAVLACMSSR
jgi:hydrogenase maturation protein HypF